MWLFETATSLDEHADLIRRRAYGVIEIAEGKLQSIRFRPWPKIVSSLHVMTVGRRFHLRATGDRCWFYYNQPRGHRNFLAFKYGVSTRQTSMRTCRTALAVLDEVARIKGADAIVCQVDNDRLTDRTLARMGFESHFPTSKQRHYIRRFYGKYPAADPELRLPRSNTADRTFVEGTV